MSCRAALYFHLLSSPLHHLACPQYAAITRNRRLTLPIPLATKPSCCRVQFLCHPLFLLLFLLLFYRYILVTSLLVWADFYLNRSESSRGEEQRRRRRRMLTDRRFGFLLVPSGGNCVLLFTRGIVVDSMPVDSVMMIPPVV